MPGDIVDLFIQPTMPPEARQELREAYGFDEPLHVQYFQYILNLLQGNLGTSFLYNKPVTAILFDKMLNTMSLSLTGVFLAYVIGPLIGAYLAWRRGSLVDTVGLGLSTVAYAAPVFWTGMVAIMVFSFQLGWFPSGGMHSVTYTSDSLIDRFVSVDFLHHLALPLIVSTLYWMTAPTLFMRSNMIDVLDEDFIEMNQAQGLPSLVILYRHAARNALLPVLHRAAIAFGLAFGGSILIEVVFSWPGAGRAMWSAVQNRDYPLAQGAFLVIATAIVTLNFVADILSVYADPRAAEGERGDV